MYYLVDYISMYQMERLKLNEKYKIKDETIRSLATQLQVNKLALSELSQYFNAFTKLSSQSSLQVATSGEVNESDETKLNKEDSLNNQSNDTVIIKEEIDSVVDHGEFNNDNSDDSEKEKKVFLLNQIESLLNDLTIKTSNTLNQASDTSGSGGSPNLGSKNKLLFSNDSNNNKLSESTTNSINAKSISDFRVNTILCSNCYGDLFID